METLAPGRIVGRYRVLRRLAVGGMAEIYLAQARGIEGFAKYVVLKRILPHLAASGTFVKLFLNEARVTASVDHPNVASVYDIGEIDGVYFFAMEYLHGEDIGQIVRATIKRRERIPLQHALTIGAGAAAGLHAAHEKKGPDGKPLGIVHRDVSPSNVVVTYDGGVKLVDFGVAKLTAEADLSRTGSLKGKIAYMSPEQCSSDPIDRRSDIFSLGVLLYELTTQTRLFRGQSDAATLKMILDARVPTPSSRVPEYPADLEAIVLRALARDRGQRYSTAREVQLALEGVARSSGLVTSTAALGDWMTRSFGPKQEPWLSPEVAALVEHQRHDAARQARPTPSLGEGTVMIEMAGDDGPMIHPPPAVDGPRGRRLVTVLAVATAVMLASVATGLAVHRLGRRAPADGVAAGAGSPAPASPAERVAAAAPAPAPAPTPAPAPPPTPERPPSGATGAAIAVRRPAGRRPVARTAAAEPRPEQFSQAFARKEPELLRCFSSSPEAAAQAPQISVRFQVAMDGGVSAADVLPAEVADTALGRCVSQVARRAQFGAQPTPVTVRIPVTVRRVGKGGTR